MEDERKQKGGKKLEQNTAIDIPEDIYLEYCTPDEQESMPKRKIRLQNIERRWAKEWKEYRFVTPKYAKKFALKPRGKRPPPEDYQDAHTSSLKTIDDYREEKSKHLSKLQKAETSGTTIPQMKSVPPKPKASKPQEKMPQKAAPKIGQNLKTTKGFKAQIVKQLPTVSSSSVLSATSSETKSSPTPLKTKNLLNLTPDALVSTHAELKTLTDKYSKLSNRQSLKNNFIKFATNAVDKYNKKAAPPAPTPQPLIEEPVDETAHAEEIPQESRADEPAIEKIAKENPADDSATTGETAPAASKPADDSAPADETASA
ncbi:hypothetical protein ZWY2020_028445 [Hordeum vulgare]|nr:hypothetical protein ZWY2020_028445 [Hordeum vulgare]